MIMNSAFTRNTVYQQHTHRCGNNQNVNLRTQCNFCLLKSSAYV